MQKWEYCTIHLVLHFGNYFLVDEGRLQRMTNTGAPDTVNFDSILAELPKDTKLTRGDIVAQAIAQLGEEGWELAGTHGGDASPHVVLYFKRPKE